MQYYDYLKNMLYPMHVYDFNVGYSNAELLALGSALDQCSLSAEYVERESCANTAEDIGLMRYEQMLPYIAPYADLQQRQQHIMSLLSVDEQTFTVDRLNAIFSSCGSNAYVQETQEKFKVIVSFPEVEGVPEDFESIQTFVQKLLPCHITVEYKINSCTWDELESAFATWNDIESAEMTFKSMELYSA